MKKIFFVFIIIFQTTFTWALGSHHRAPQKPESCFQYLTRSAVEYFYPPELGPRVFPPDLYGELEDGDLRKYRIYVSEGLVVDRDGFAICPDVPCRGTLLIDEKQRLYFSTIDKVSINAPLIFSDEVALLNGEPLDPGSILAKFLNQDI